MPSVSVDPAVLTWTPQSASFQPERVTFGAAHIAWTGGEVALGPSNGTSLTATVPELDRLTSFDQLLNTNGTPSLRFMVIWQETVEKIEEAFEALTTQVSDNSAIIARLVAAEAVAAAAAATAAETEAREALSQSYVNPTQVLTATSSGVVSIAAHSRIYGDGSSVSVNSGSVSGFGEGDYVTIYYDDAAREGGAVAYSGTTSAVAQSGNRHVVGSVTIPAAGAGTTTGVSPTAPGYTADDVTRDYFFL